MSNFNFQARDKTGNLIKGIRSAPSSDYVYRFLVKEGYTPIKIDKISEEFTQDVDTYIQSKFPHSKKIQEQKLIMCRQMGSMLNAGVTMIDAISTVAETVNHKYFKKILLEIASDIQSGQKLSKSLQKYEEVFGKLFIGVIAIGENTGNIGQGFKYLAHFYGRTIRNRFRLKEATRYPLIVVIMFLVAMVIINIIFFPVIKKAYDKYEGELPLITHIFIMISDFIINYWYIAISTFILAFIILKRIINLEKIKVLKQKYMLYIPIIGSISKRVLIQRFCQSFAVTVESGYPVNEGLKLMKDSVDNIYFQNMIEQMSEDVATGKSLYQSAKDTKFFPPLFLRLLETSEKSGNIADVLYYIADQYEEELEYEFKYIVEIIRPLLMIIIGICLGIFVLAVLLPYYNLIYVVIDYINRPKL